MIIFIFGDSITQGYWDESGGWADNLKKSVLKRDVENDLKYYHGIHNLGIDGNTTAQVIERFDNETKARFWRNAEYGVVFAVGLNDTSVTQDGQTISSPSQYQEELKTLFEKAQSFTSNIAFVNLTPADEALTNPLPASSTGKCFTNERINSFNLVLKDFCDQNKAQLIDVHSLFTSSGEELLADGLHPNLEGHRIIERAVADVVSEWLY